MNLDLKNITPPLGVAVSGGADSLALTLLAHTWAKAQQGHIVALTVDHGLRPESTEEAHRLSAWLEKRGIHHVILRWEGDKPLTHLQERAREARYNLLLSWCKDHQVSTLLLGHHQQDQEETFWLRLAAGSGLDGLTVMKERSIREGITLLRPFLKHTKEDLKAFLRAEGQDWLEDPSNEAPQFLRSKLRAALQEEGLSSSRLERTIGKLQEDFDFIQKNLSHALQTLVTLHEEGFLTLDKEGFDGLHPSLGKRVISKCMQWFSSSPYPPRTDTVQSILEKLKLSSPFTAGGIYWFFRGENVYLSRELAAIERPLFFKDLKQPTLWDNRFWVDPELKSFLPQNAFLAPLGLSSFATIKDISTDVPRCLLPTLPALWIKEKIAAIPHLCYTSVDCRKDVKKFISIPPLS